MAVVVVVADAAAHADVVRGEDHAIARAPDSVTQGRIGGGGAATMAAVRRRCLFRAAAHSVAGDGAAGRRPA